MLRTALNRIFGSPLTLAVLATLCMPAWCGAQFIPSGGTAVRERVAGVLRLAPDAPIPRDGDQLAAFFDGKIASEVFQFTVASAQSLEFSIVIFGNDPGSEEVEGPSVGDAVEFRYYRASTNMVYRRLGTLNVEGEVFNYVFNGLELPDFIDGFPFPIDLIPTAPLDLRLTGNPEDSGGSLGEGGSGEGEGPPNYDVNRDGRVNVRDAAEILRVMSGASFRVVAPSRADVNRDGRVDMRDVIAVMRNRDR